MPREDVATKARRYLIEARLTIRKVGQALIAASCRGDSGEVYELGYSPSTGWSCTCAARGRCCHVQALMLVVLRPKEQAA